MLFKGVRRYAVTGTLLSVVVMVACAGMARWISLESNVLHFFSDTSLVVRDYEWMEEHLTGLSTIEFDVKESEVGRGVTFLQRFQKVFPLAMGERLMVTPGTEGEWRGSLYVRAMETGEFNRLVERVEWAVKRLKGEQVEVGVTGTVVLLNRVQAELIRTQVVTILTMGLGVGVVLVVVLRRFRWIFAGVVANFFPVIVLFGLMGMLGISLNAGTIMVASIALGIAVDDTLFFLMRLKGEGGGAEGLERCYREVAVPITLTSLMMGIGFLVMAGSEFEPIRYFGLLGGMTMGVAWLGDMVLMPMVLIMEGGTSVGRKEDEA